MYEFIFVAIVLMLVIVCCLVGIRLDKSNDKKTDTSIHEESNSDIYTVLNKEEYKTWLIQQKGQVKQIFTKLYNNSERIVKAKTLNPEYIKCEYIHIECLEINENTVSTKCCFVYSYCQYTYQIDWKINIEGLKYDWKINVKDKR